MRKCLQILSLLAGLTACTRTATTSDGTAIDASSSADDLGISSNEDARPSCGKALQAPQTELRPVAGELFYAQWGLGGLAMGESALVVAPNGQQVLIDVGNNSHAADIAAAIQRYTGGSVIDDIVITHYHADHGDGLDGLLRRITLRGHIIHRGRTDNTAAANQTTLQSVCSLAERTGKGALELCQADGTVSCDPSTWGGTRPARDCGGTTAAQRVWGPTSGMDFVAANGRVGPNNYATSVMPIQTTDSNGENARSVVAILRHGAFHMLVAGDLTGGGSNTDAVEGYYSSKIPLISPTLGVDVLHAGHHGRNTSSSQPWVDRWLPADGRARNAVMGISTAHVGSPHSEVLQTIGNAQRLGTGSMWTTRISLGGANHPALRSADGGHILIATQQQGASYVIQSVSGSGAVISSSAYYSVRSCD